MSSIQFNGQVTINGNVEIFDNGSMKINGDQINIEAKNLTSFIEGNLKNSPNKADYIEASKVLNESSDKDKIRSSFQKIKEMALELGKAIFISGLSQIAVEVIKQMVK